MASSKKKKTVSGSVRAKAARKRYVEHKKRSKASKKGAETRRTRAREGAYGQLEQRGQLRRDQAHVIEHSSRYREALERAKRAEEKARILQKQLTKIERVQSDLRDVKRYDRGLFKEIARKHRMRASEVYTLWLYH